MLSRADGGSLARGGGCPCRRRGEGELVAVVFLVPLLLPAGHGHGGTLQASGELADGHTPGILARSWEFLHRQRLGVGS